MLHKVVCKALPRYPNRQKLVDKIRSDFSKADETWGVFHSKQHLKELYDQLAGLDEAMANLLPKCMWNEVRSCTRSRYDLGHFSGSRRREH